MKKNFSEIFINKKIIFFIVPLFVAIGFIIPGIAHAGWVGCAGGAAIGVLAGLATWYFGPGGVAIGVGTGVAVGAALGCVAGAGTEAVLNKFLGDTGTQLFRAILVGGIDLITWITLGLAKFSAIWLKAFIDSDSINTSILKQPAFMMGWTQVRDLSNMFIVLGFIVVGIATALRLREYEAKKLLAPLLTIALLINFSGLFCGLIIDGTNILTNHFLQAGGGDVGTTIITAFESARTLPPKQGGTDWDALLQNKDAGASYVSALITYPIAYIMIAIVFFYLVILLVARQAIFGILFVLSPLAFFCWIFPPTKKIWTMWWENFIKWGLIGAQVGFFLWVAALMIGGTTGTAAAAKTSYVSFLGILVLLYVAITVAKKSSGVGASAVMGLAGVGLGMAMGATKALGGATAERLSRTRKAQGTREAASNTVARMQEWTGFAPQGHAAEQKAKRTSEARKQMDALRNSQNPGDRSRFEQLVRTGTGPMGAAAIASANEKGELDKIINPAGIPPSLSAVNARVAYATQFGHERSDFENKDYRLAGLNDKKAQELAQTQNISIDDARKKLVENKLDENLMGMSHSQLRNIDPSHLTTERVKKLSSEKLSAFRTGSPAQITQIKGPSVRGSIAAERDQLAVTKGIGNQRIDEGKLSKLNEQLKEIDNL